MEFVELPPAPARRLMRDVWTGAAAEADNDATGRVQVTDLHWKGKRG